jgi:beta-lactam-binding protein with PASTA domain
VRPRLPLLLLALLGAAVAAAGCGETEPKAVPNVVGLQLDAAQARLDARGLDSDITGGGTFGVILRSHWQVCDQVPRPGRRAVEVTLVVERACSQLGPVRSGVVPDVENETLDDAERELMHAGLGYDLESDGVIFVRSNWTVCEQDPPAGEWAATVELYVERDCWDW